MLHTRLVWRTMQKINLRWALEMADKMTDYKFVQPPQYWYQMKGLD